MLLQRSSMIPFLMRIFDRNNPECMRNKGNPVHLILNIVR